MQFVLRARVPVAGSFVIRIFTSTYLKCPLPFLHTTRWPIPHLSFCHCFVCLSSALLYSLLDCLIRRDQKLTRTNQLWISATCNEAYLVHKRNSHPLAWCGDACNWPRCQSLTECAPACSICTDCLTHTTTTHTSSNNRALTLESCTTQNLHFVLCI